MVQVWGLAMGKPSALLCTFPGLQGMAVGGKAGRVCPKGGGNSAKGGGVPALWGPARDSRAAQECKSRSLDPFCLPGGPLGPCSPRPSFSPLQTSWAITSSATMLSPTPSNRSGIQWVSLGEAGLEPWRLGVPGGVTTAAPLSLSLQRLTLSQRALANIHTQLQGLEREAVPQFPSAQVGWFAAVSLSTPSQKRKVVGAPSKPGTLCRAWSLETNPSRCGQGLVVDPR